MIPVFEPYIGEEEAQAVAQTILKGEISGSFGDTLPSFEQKFADYVGCDYGMAVSNGTSALHLAVAAANIQKGDEVLVSSSTNIATALAVVHNGAIPIPVDSEPNTWNLDLDLVEKLITPKTKAIIAVHLFGHPVYMPKLVEICKKHNLVLIEDCAESHGATIDGQMTGSFGDIACFSFYANKVITTGEGGMVTTSNKQYAEKVKLLRNLGFTQPRFKHFVAGYNFRMTGYQAAMGLEQLRKIDYILDKKIDLAHRYNLLLKDIDGVQIPQEEPWAKHVYWMYAITLDPLKGNDRDVVMKRLWEEDQIQTRTFFCPMNQQPCLETVEGFRAIECPVADQLWKQGLYLPSSINLSEETIQVIVDKLIKYYKD